MAVYNTEAYLEEAVESVLRQDIGFKDNVQLILVDDGSTDKSGMMCDAYAQRYPDNIRIVHKENGGPASARNAGLPFADGRYLNFLDSDDKFTENVLSEVYNFFIKHEDETDIVAIPMIFFGGRSDEHYLNYKFKKGDRIIDLYKEYNAALRHVGSSFLNARYKSDIHFDERLIDEDIKLVLSLLYRKMTMGVVSSCKYMYRRRDSGEVSLVETAQFDHRYSFERLKYVTEWAEAFYEEKLGFVPAYVQYENMIEFALRTKDNYNKSILTNEEMEQYKNTLFEYYKHIDDEYILKQTILGKEHKNFVLSKKYGKNPQITPRGNDALIHFGNSVVCCISDCQVKLEFMECKNNTLCLEGVTTILGVPDDEQATPYVLFNGEKIPCEPTERESNTVCFDEVISRGVGFKCRAPMDRMAEQGEIQFGVVFRGTDVLKKTVQFGKFFPLVKSLKNSYYHAGDLVLTFSDDRLEWRKGVRQDAKDQEKALLKELWQRGEKATRDAAVARRIYRLIRPLVKKEIWIVSDRINKADDNGEALFDYINKNKLPVNAYFVLRKDSADYADVGKLGNVVNHMSWKHKMLHLLADKIISSSAAEHVYNPFQTDEKYYHDILVKKPRIFLQHGVIKHDLSNWLNRYNRNLSMFVVSTRPEYDSILNGAYHYDAKIVKLTGLARHDRLEDRGQKIIAIMPTWRRKFRMRPLNPTTGKESFGKSFFESEYFAFYNNLLNNEKLLHAADKYGYRIKFMPHPIVIQFIDKFHQNDAVEFCSIGTKYRDIFAESSLVVTDYSSAALDAAYLRKPIVYCQFDKERFYQEHIYTKGYFERGRDEFGEVEQTLDGTVDRIIEYMKNGCALKDVYRERIDKFFAFNDRNNCKRVYEAINEIGRD